MAVEKKEYGHNIRVDEDTFQAVKEIIKETRHTMGGYVALAVVEKIFRDTKSKKK